MAWSHKWSKHLESGFYYEQLKKGWIKEEDCEPELGHLDFYITAFFELSTCRINSMSLGAIPFTAIVEYSRLYDVGDFQEFLYLIRRMDSKYLSLNDKSEGKSESVGSKGSTRDKN